MTNAVNRDWESTLTSMRGYQMSQPLRKTESGLVHVEDRITPERCSELLKSSIGNRRISPWKVRQYAKFMVSGQWKLNGQGLIFDWNGKLRNGHHRLFACIEAGVPFETTVTYGVDPDAYDTMDTNKPRTASDVLGTAGALNTFAVAAAMRWVQVLRSGRSYGSNELTPSEALAWWTSDKSIEESVRRSLVAKKIIGPGMAGACHFMFAQHDAEAADRFFEDLALGAELEAHDPVLVLRERLIASQLKKARLKRQEIVALCIRAWNHRREGRMTGTLKGLVRNKDGSASMPPISP